MIRFLIPSASLMAIALASPASAQEYGEEEIEVIRDAVDAAEQAIRAEAFAELPYWPGYWVSELQVGTLIGGHNPQIAEAIEAGEPIPDFMRLNGGNAPWTEEGLQRRRDVRAAARGRASAGWGFPMMMNAATPFVISITPELVTIANSYNEVRYIYTDGREMPDELDMWPTTYGTSIGHWEGDTLVVETVMVSTPSDFFHGAPPFSEETTYHERITLEDDRLVSRMVIDDPVMLREPWEVEVAWVRDEAFDRMVQMNWENDRTGFDGTYNTIEAPDGANGTAMLLPAIDGVLEAGAAWEVALSGPMTADGMSVTPEGHLLFAQEQSNAIWRLTPDDEAFVEYPYVLGAGAVSVTSDGTVLAIERGCTDPGLEMLQCDRRPALMQLGSTRSIIADEFGDGSSLGRLNDVHADGQGGAWVTQGALWHISHDGETTMVYQPEAFTNGVTTSPDGSTLYVTDMRNVIGVALDNGVNGETSLFATLDEDTEGFGGDGMAVDADGRLYVTGDAGIYVFAPDGTKLGVIPVPRRAITLAFAGADRRTLYVGAMGAPTPEGEDWVPPGDERNVAMTVYKLPMLAAGPR